MVLMTITWHAKKQAGWAGERGGSLVRAGLLCPCHAAMPLCAVSAVAAAGPSRPPCPPPAPLLPRSLACSLAVSAPPALASNKRANGRGAAAWQAWAGQGRAGGGRAPPTFVRPWRRPPEVPTATTYAGAPVLVYYYSTPATLHPQSESVAYEACMHACMHTMKRKGMYIWCGCGTVRRIGAYLRPIDMHIYGLRLESRRQCRSLDLGRL